MSGPSSHSREDELGLTLALAGASPAFICTGRAIGSDPHDHRVDLRDPLPYNLLIVGGSVRAAASSAMRAGYRPWCADQFADRDLARVCEVVQIEAGRAGFERLVGLVDCLRSTPWIYTGGLENHPDVVEQISRRHPLWGVGAAVLAGVRDPARVADVLQAAGIACPRVALRSDQVPRDGTWLAKPLRSGGGIGIESYTGDKHGDDPGRYYQERVEGESYSALYVGTRSAAHLVGVSLQLVGIPGAPFVYRGSVGPVPVSPSVGRRLERIGHCLAERFGLEGWFGVDYLSEGKTVWPVEVNPRYTASVEIHELARRQAMLPLHALACTGKSLQGLDGWDSWGRAPAIVVGKSVVYASREIEIGPIDWAPDAEHDPFAIPEIADIPQAGARFGPGEPVLSVLAAGPGLADCEVRLLELEHKWRRSLGLDGPASN